MRVLFYLLGNSALVVLPFYFLFLTSLPLLLADEVSYHKLAAQNIYRELSEADEANLLDEEGDLFKSELVIILPLFQLKILF